MHNHNICPTCKSIINEERLSEQVVICQSCGWTEESNQKYITRSLNKKITMNLSILASLLILGFFHNAQADFFEDNKDQIKEVMRDFSSSTIHSTITGASQKSMILGVELGISASSTKQKGTVKNILNEVGNSSENFYLSSFYGLISLPLGLTLEASMIPKVKIKNLSIDQKSLALKINFAEFLPLIPFNVGGRIHYSTGRQGFRSANNLIELNHRSLGAQAILSWDLPFVEPYVSLGYLSTKSDLSAPSLSDRIITDKLKGLQWAAGVSINLLLFTTGLEIQSNNNTKRALAKVGLSF